VFAPLLRLCGSEFPAVIRIRAESMSHISKMALGVINVLPFGDPDHVLLHSFSTLAPLVFASDKKPAIDAAMAQFSPPSADKPNLSLDRFALMEAGDASGEQTMFGQISKGMTNRGHAMFGISTYHGTNPQFWSIEFTGEEGQDAGGLFRDTISNIADELMSDKTPVFINSGNAIDGTCWVPNPACHNVQQYKFIGQMMGACIRTGETLGVDLAPYFWKKLAGGPVTWDDFAACAPTVACSLVQVEEMASSGLSAEDFESLCLVFTFTALGGVEIELVPAGESIDVTLDNCAEFCRLAKAACMAQFDEQIALIRSGLDDYQIPMVALLLWTEEEFQTKVAGQLDIPIEGLRSNLTLSGNNQQKEYFWEAVEKLDVEQRSMLLKFGSGRSRLPCHLSLTLGSGSSRYGTASTCSFEMYLPTYESADAMYEGILATIACGSFGNA